ncbi:outer membrane beta-barrel protein [Wenyingzhuangia sp. IMCC45467]
MKKLLFIALLVLGTNFAKAQEDKTSISAGYTSVKLKLKLNIPDYDVSETESMDATGFFVGLMREIQINSKYSFTPGVIYTNLSSDEDDDDEKIEYIQIPFLFNYYPNEKVFLSAGPKVDFLIEDQTEDGFHKISLALGLGIGFELSSKLNIIANYSIQLSDSLGDEFDDNLSSEANTDVNATLKQNFFNIGLAYNF